MSNAAPRSVLDWYLAPPLDRLETASSPKERVTASIGVVRACWEVERAGYSLPADLTRALAEVPKAGWRARGIHEHSPRPDIPSGAVNDVVALVRKLMSR